MRLSVLPATLAICATLATPLHAQDAPKFLGGAAVALVAHETGHLVFDLAFIARPHLRRVEFGPIPFFAVEHASNLPRHKEFLISSAGFWVQEATNEWLLAAHPHLREEHAPFLKGVFAFNVLTSVGYAGAAFAKVGPAERDTRSIATGARIDEGVVGAMILAPAVLDAVRYYKPDARWAVWMSRVVKLGSVVLVAK